MRAGRFGAGSLRRPPCAMKASLRGEAAAGSHCGYDQFAERNHSRLAAQLLPIRVAAVDSHRAATPQPRSRAHNARRSAVFSPKYPMSLPSGTCRASSRMHFAWSGLSFEPRPTSQQDTSVIFAHFFLLEAPSSANTQPNFRQRPIAPRRAAAPPALTTPASPSRPPKAAHAERTAHPIRRNYPQTKQKSRGLHCADPGFACHAALKTARCPDTTRDSTAPAWAWRQGRAPALQPRRT